MRAKNDCSKAVKARGTRNTSKAAAVTAIPKEANEGVRMSITERYIELHAAASTLHRHLGETLEHWLDYLKADLTDSMQDDGDSEFGWSNHEGAPYCKVNPLYSFIAWRNPKSVGVYSDEVSSQQLSIPLGIDVSPVVDHENGGRLLVRHTPDYWRTDTSLLTVQEARAFANELLKVAQYCEEHVYHYGLCEVEKRVDTVDRLCRELERKEQIIQGKPESKLHMPKED
jgi:hypothetical protein